MEEKFSESMYQIFFFSTNLYIEFSFVIFLPFLLSSTSPFMSSLSKRLILLNVFLIERLKMKLKVDIY